MTKAAPQLLELKRTMLLHLAWPLKALYENPDGTNFAGFVMTSAPEHSIPFDILAQFPPNAAACALSMRQKIVALMDFCYLAEELHEIGVTIGDRNGANLLVDETGRVTMIDVDAYGFTLHGEHHPTCARPGYVAPEILQQMKTIGTNDFSELADITGTPVFTPATDDFGLAVHIFELLNFGVHPFDS